MSIILYTLGAIAILEGLTISIAPINTKRIVLKLLRDTPHVRKLGITELTLGIILILIAYLL